MSPVLVTIEGTDRVHEGRPGEDLLEVLQSNGEPIATACGGIASCGQCRLTVVSGAEALVPIKPQELVHLGNVAKVLGLRLACQAQIVATVAPGAALVIRVPPLEDVTERKRRKADRGRKRPPDPTPLPERPIRVEWRPDRSPVKLPEAGGKGG